MVATSHINLLKFQFKVKTSLSRSLRSLASDLCTGWVPCTGSTGQHARSFLACQIKRLLKSHGQSEEESWVLVQVYPWDFQNRTGSEHTWVPWHNARAITHSQAPPPFLPFSLLPSLPPSLCLLEESGPTLTGDQENVLLPFEGKTFWQHVFFAWGWRTSSRDTLQNLQGKLLTKCDSPTKTHPTNNFQIQRSCRCQTGTDETQCCVV